MQLDSVPTSQRKNPSLLESSGLMLFRKLIALYCKHQNGHKYVEWAKLIAFDVKHGCVFGNH
jgi:hypothetical protein